VGQSLVLFALEALAVYVEANYFKAYGEKIKRPVLLAIGANTFSFLTGKAIEVFLR
jgi:hypothetical protein